MKGMDQVRFSSVLRALNTDFGTWSRDDVVAACARAGWVVEDDFSGVRMPECEGGGWLSDDGAEYLRADPALAQLGILAGTIEPHQFRDYIALATEVWGTPSFHGGDLGVFVRWRQQTTTRALYLRHDGLMSVSAFASYAIESLEDSAWRHNEALEEVPFTWLGELGGGDMIGFGYSHHLVNSWRDLTAALTRTLQDLQLGMIALGNPLTDNDGPLEDIVVVTLAATAPDDDRVLQIMLSTEEPAVWLHDDERWHDQLVAHGFHPHPDDPDYPWLREVPVGKDGCAELATLAVSFLQILGLELDALNVEFWRYNDPYEYFELTCVGVPEAQVARYR
ncbi:hypothetical protein JK358_13815 [Nocardia sp. 2]|uniref:TY-Chap N-terminal domain-containing protein n=1 Tax=Nocardia acididurans TaxID=2802282 RepID=A0ABS1M575_9NOCA|nr:hypothetical protein [Nocardia acididurans]MBL1075471.1 hypothetical protein [Nocardia acididurans]